MSYLNISLGFCLVVVVPGIFVAAFRVRLSVFAPEELLYFRLRDAEPCELVMYELVLALYMLVVSHDHVEVRQPHGAREIREDLLRPELQFGQPAGPHAPVERLRLHVLLLRGRVPVPAAGRNDVLGQLDAEPAELL